MKQLRLLAATVLLSLPLASPAKTGEANSKAKNRDMAQEALLVELTGKDLSKESDITLYAEMVSAYDGNDEIALKSRLQSLLSRFPQSAYADNALFLAGRMAVDNANYAQAIKYFSQIEKQYPRSNKVAAAKYAKAMTYKRMNLPEFSRKALVEVRSKYPGSPESFRADAELKVLK
ncbi:outer membrane protein assembly factor BamD [Bdellovibrio bacteriovorus]|uniref:tetratricopeptide repeat protein n=1 Tax=Bdellovibrio bacteriovorus TaxID=959 RepID=UPI0021D196BE|nr:tetratricopeptide repeat protein [Bdellovibrio bacteriovorus]UXR63147.1 outer membrane protein assembly factor BamD [Bdellovibrio bacteriovorus]